MKKHFLSIVFFTLTATIFGGCATGSGARQLSGRYVSRETGGVIDGQFYYAFTTPTKELPRNVGYYRFEHAGDAVPLLSVRSAHVGQFIIRVSATGDQVFVTNPAISAGEQKYEKQ